MTTPAVAASIAATTPLAAQGPQYKNTVKGFAYAVLWAVLGSTAVTLHQEWACDAAPCAIRGQLPGRVLQIGVVCLFTILRGVFLDIEPRLERGLVKQAEQKGKSEHVKHIMFACPRVIGFILVSMLLLVFWQQYTCPPLQTLSGSWVVEPKCDSALIYGATVITLVGLAALFYANYLDVSQALAVGTQECEREMEEVKKK